MERAYTIEPYSAGTDDLNEITALLHRAYAPLLGAGMNYLAAMQPVQVTEKRLASSTVSWLARMEDRVIGIVSYYSRVVHSARPEWYASGDVGVFAQFAVDPIVQKRGIGYALLRAVEEHAIHDGKGELACDTAEGATELRQYYARFGFREVAVHHWPDATYNSVILSKAINGE